jgi:hypothetical protein
LCLPSIYENSNGYFTTPPTISCFGKTPRPDSKTRRQSIAANHPIGLRGTSRGDCRRLLVSIRRSSPLSLSERKRGTLQNKQPQHPPNQKNADNCHEDVTDPLAGRFGTSEIEHAAMVASALKTEPPRISDYGAALRLPDALPANRI